MPAVGHIAFGVKRYLNIIPNMLVNAWVPVEKNKKGNQAMLIDPPPAFSDDIQHQVGWVQYVGWDIKPSQA